ncbi:MAG: amidohydrolase [Candidatus Rokubacteria bacterium]|nr:amidohydrolase [Candidatus Rokubacteria bacterium]
MEAADLFIRGATVLTLDPRRRVIRDGGVVVEGRCIKAVGRRDELERRYRASRTIDAGGRVALPGFVDAHVHVHQAFVRSLTHGEPYQFWSRIFRPFEYLMTEEDAYVSALLHILTSIRMGIACFVDSGGYHPDAVAAAVSETGIRCVLSRLTMDTAADLPHTRQGVPPESTGEALEKSVRLIERWHRKADGRLRTWLSLNQLMVCSDELYRQAKILSEKHGVGIQTHLCAFRPEVEFALLRWGKRPVEHLDELGVLGPRFLAAHATLLSDPDIRRLAERDVRVVHCPNSAVMAKQGIPKVPQMLAAGITVALGGDGYFVDQIECMKFATVLHTGYWGERYADPEVLLPETLVEMATLNGARAVGWDDEIGSLEAGKRADIILLAIGRAHQTPHWDLLAELVHYSYSGDIDTVIVDGRVLMENRKVLVLDEEDVLRRAQARAARIFREGVERGLIRKVLPLERWPVE